MKKITDIVNPALLLLLGLSAALIMTVNIDRIPKALEAGQVATKDIKADKNYDIVDEKSTETFRNEAEAGILSVYDFDQTVEAGIEERIHAAFSQAREALSAAARGKKKVSTELEKEVRSIFEAGLGSLVMDERYSLIRAYRFHPAIESGLSAM
ncbi:MAG: hypothetical protein Q7T11_10020, partial [Deltaproteobacteria bacterium]|nr:hypothetical protein [Deltaproteobacteria bacterium]